MGKKHEFDGWVDDRGNIDHKLCKCGQREAHEDHFWEDGTGVIETETVFDRMDARGFLRPPCTLAIIFFVSSAAQAQDEPPAVPSTAESAAEFRLPEPGEILPLHRGTAAPRDGLLIDAGDLLQIQQEYERMRFLLGRATERDREVCDVRVEMEHARLTACEERLRLRDELWDARQLELRDAVTEARAEARRAAERQWFESPVLWFLVGALATGVVWIAVAASP